MNNAEEIEVIQTQFCDECIIPLPLELLKAPPLCYLKAPKLELLKDPEHPTAREAQYSEI